LLYGAIQLAYSRRACRCFNFALGQGKREVEDHRVRSTGTVRCWRPTVDTASEASDTLLQSALQWTRKGILDSRALSGFAVKIHFPDIASPSVALKIHCTT